MASVTNIGDAHPTGATYRLAIARSPFVSPEGQFMRARLLAATGVLMALVLPATAAVASPDQPGGQLVRTVAAAGTPHVLDGEVLSIAQVGNTMVLGGTFTSARNDNSQTAMNRSRLLAFDATSGLISTTFLPQPNGQVRSVVPAGDGTTVYVGGNFTSIGGVARRNLARVRVSDGAVVSTFNAGTISGQIRDMVLRNGRLWLAGAFTHVGGRAQRGLVSVDPATGAVQNYMSLAIAGVHNSGTTQVLKIDVTPDGSRLVAVGNFDTLNGVQNRQLFMLDLTGATAQPSAFRTSFYTSTCSRNFDSYMRDVDFSPAGDFFVVSTTGAYGGSEAACDTAARFDTDQSGTNIAPSWVDYTGGDTSYAVEVTDSVVYIGGHQRWWNNPFRGDAAGQGAVSREGIAALDPTNGLPLSWNPTRTKGVGVFDFLVTGQGLWVASDTDRIGAYQLKSRIARMLPGGTSFPTIKTTVLPNDVYTVRSSLTRRRYDATVGAEQAVNGGGIDWNAVRGSFMLNGQLYLAHSDGSFTRRTFDGSAFGAPVSVATHDQIVALTDWRSDIASATSMFYDRGRIYFTRTGSSQLFYRYFSPESDVVGAKRLVASNNVSGIDFSQARGAFVTDSHLYWSTPDGALRRIGWQQTPQAAVPVAGTATVVSGPGVDGVNWSGARGHFLFQNPAGGGAVTVNQPPTARISVSCAELTCTFDGTTSSDPEDGTAGSFAWQFGDGATGTGSVVQHTYANAGSFEARLTVTDSGSLTGTTTRTVQPTTAGVALVGANSANANATTHRVAVPAGTQAGDALVLLMSTNTTGTTVATPAGWTPLETLDGNAVRGRAWTRTATAGEAGSLISVVASGTTKADLTLASYRATGGSGTSVSAHAGYAATTSGTTHTSPQTTSSRPGSWVVTYWAAKASSPVTWTPPAGNVRRSGSSGGGGGAIYSMLTDAGQPTATGTVGGLQATTDIGVTRVVAITLVVGPA